MPQREVVPQKWARRPHTGHDRQSGYLLGLESTSHGKTAQFSFETIRPGIFRTQFWSDTHPLPPYPNIFTPFASKAEPTSGAEQAEILISDDIQAEVDWKGTPVVSVRWKDSSTNLHSDLPDRSYVFDGSGASHYTRHDRNALHVGLGEKAAPMDLTGRGFKLDATDCFGYEVFKSDPMYKHIPLLIKATPDGCVGLFSTSHSRGSWTVGSEIDGLWGHFKVMRQDYGGLQEYIMVGKTLKDVVRLYAELAGFPHLVPRWAYGYLSGGYKYTMQDDPPAYKTLLEFADKLKEHDIPCSAHQMSSGYSIAEVEPKVRNVFTWNKHRFPDPEAWLAKCNSLGLRLFTNIKPFVLESHPEFQYLKKSKALFTDPRTTQAASMKLWSAGGGESGNGSHIDFTSTAGSQWWANGVEKLRRQGVAGAWNDNNEYTLPNDDWQMALEDYPDVSEGLNNVGLWGRAMHCELMAKASYDGLLRAAPNERPFVLTRSATPGTMRYACCSWSGDNMTSWEGMKGANAINLTAGISLLQCFGPDIGGFEGPQPSPELLLRWVQMGIYAPRFAINCFKTSPQDNQAGEVIEPWMYPEITPLIRDVIKRRYEMLPYIYSLGLESHLFASPSQRWVGWGYEPDPEVWTTFLKNGEEQYWFGDSLLIGGAYEPGLEAVKLYLPRGADNTLDFGYVNTNAPYEYFSSGQWVTILCPWKTSVPVLAKVGGAVPVGKRMQTKMPGEVKSACATLEADDYRGIELFPPKRTSHGQTFKYSWYDDDGISIEPDISRFTIRYSSTDETVTVAFESAVSNHFVPPWVDTLTFVLLPGDDRFMISDQGVPLEHLTNDQHGRPRFRMSTGVSRTATLHSVPKSLRSRL